ncbi:MAG: hypothetical protein ACYDAC_03445 [Candidatus Dormibacteria bacterium]
MSLVRSFVLFWWDFVVGDDPAIAAGVVVMLGLCALLAHAGVSAWWLPPLTVAGVLVVSAARAQRRR